MPSHGSLTHRQRTATKSRRTLGLRWLNFDPASFQEPRLRRPSLHRRLSAWCLAALVFGAGPAMAQYIWKDNRGQVHVSDMAPPRDIPDKDVLQRPATRPSRGQALPAGGSASAVPATALPGKLPVDPELEARRKRADDEAKARSRADEDRLALQRSENCQRARQQMAVLDNGQRLVRYNDRGERVLLDDAARADEAQAARRAMAQDCR